MGKLDGNVGVVTGAARGVGRADALLFAKEGAAVLVSDVDEGPLKEVVEEIKAAGGKSEACAGDVTKPEDCQKMMDMAADKICKKKIFVNNARVPQKAVFVKIT